MFVLIENEEWGGVTLCQKTDGWRAVSYCRRDSKRWEMAIKASSTTGTSAIARRKTLEGLESALLIGVVPEIRESGLHSGRQYRLISNEEATMILFSADEATFSFEE